MIDKTTSNIFRKFVDYGDIFSRLD